MLMWIPFKTTWGSIAILAIGLMVSLRKQLVALLLFLELLVLLNLLAIYLQSFLGWIHWGFPLAFMVLMVSEAMVGVSLILHTARSKGHTVFSF